MYEYIQPIKIVKVEGKVENASNFLLKQEIAPTFGDKNLEVLTKEKNKRTYVVLDFGKEIHGSLELIVTRASKHNVNIRLTFGESVGEALSDIGYKNATNDHSPRDLVVPISMLGNFEYGSTGFRFVKIELVEDDTWVAFKTVLAVLKLEDHERIGYIKTNDELINKILDTATYTCILNAQNGYIWDGIKRDRLVWSGDLYSEILTLSYQYGAIDNIKNSLILLKETTSVSEWMNHIPTYSLWWILNSIAYFNLSNDTEFINNSIEYINTILKDVDKCIDEKGNINFAKTGKNPGMEFFLDWPSFETDDAYIGTAMLVLYTMNIILDSNIDNIDLESVKSIKNKLEVHKNAKTKFKQVLSTQIMCGRNNDNDKDELELNGSHGFTTFMSYFILSALHKSGSKKVLDLIKEYYGGMLKVGATTFFEDFDIDWLDNATRIDEIPDESKKDIHGDYGRYCYIGYRHSLCHGWSSGVVPFFYEKVLGLTILDSGFKKVSFNPDLMDLEWVEAKIATPYGEIFVKFEGDYKEIVVPKEIEIV